MNCRGQGYDNGSNMSGSYKGAQAIIMKNNHVKSFFVVQNFNIALNKVDFFRSHKLFVTLSSVAIASKWDEPEKIKVFIVSTVGRKVLQSQRSVVQRRKGKAQLHSVVQYRMFSERRNALCAITPGETLLLATATDGTL